MTLYGFLSYAACALFAVAGVVGYACCVAAGRSDRAAEPEPLGRRQRYEQMIADIARDARENGARK